MLLQRAGVPVVGRVNLGLTHAAEMSFRVAVPESYRAAARDIRGSPTRREQLGRVHPVA